MASVAGFFKKIVGVFKFIWKGIDKVVPDEQIIAAIEYVEAAADQFLDNSLRRAWVVEQLMKRFPISESLARLITELAVTQVKRGIDKLADEAEEAVTN